jgi:hypothetical protein
MGRPNQCNVCCGGDPPEPPDIGDCERVICITFMDENDKDFSSFQQKYQYFKAAYPERLLFVLDVENGNNRYPQNFIDSDTAYSLRDEHLKDPNITNGLRYIKRENPTGGGDTTTANSNDAWGRIKSIVNYYGGDILAKFNAATEFAVFRDNSGSMSATQVEATYDKLKADALVDGKLEARAVVNTDEDTVCPFVQGQCCTNSSSTFLMTLCGITPDCDPEALNFTQQPEDALIREYCDNTQFFTPGEGFDTVCGTCLNEQQEDDKQSTEFTAVATNGAGEGLNVPLSFSLQASDDLSNWSTIENLPDGTSGQEQSLSALLDDWDGNSVNTTDCHKWLSGEEAFDLIGEVFYGDENGDQGGYSVDINDFLNQARVIIGYPHAAPLQKKGYVRVFAYTTNSGWQQLGQDLGITNLPGFEDGNFVGENVAISRDGNTIAWTHRQGAGNHLLQVADFNEGTLEWDIKAVFNGFGSNSFIDMRISGDGNSIIMGDGDFNNGNGIVYIWGRDYGTPGNWGLKFTDTLGLGRTGTSVAINFDGTVFASSRPGDGEVNVYSIDALGVTSQIGNRILITDTGDQIWGASIDLNLDGTRIAIGNRTTVDGIGPSNYVYDYDADSELWNRVGNGIANSRQRTLLSDPQIRLDQGTGNYLIVGNTTIPSAGGSSYQGSARVYKYSQDSNTWNLISEAITWNDRFNNPNLNAQIGHSVAISPDYDNNSDFPYIIIGAPNDPFDGSNYPGSARVYETVLTQGSCDQYQETIIGSCRKRVWSRRFRIKAQTDNGIVAYSDPFQIYQWYGPNDVDPPSPDAGRWLGGDEITAGRAGNMFSNSNFSLISFGDFCDAKGLNYIPEPVGPPLLTGTIWNYRSFAPFPDAFDPNFSKGLVWIFDAGNGRVNDFWEQLTGFVFTGGEDDGYSTESSIWASEFARGTIVDVAGNRAPADNQIVAVQAGQALPRVELFDKTNYPYAPKLDTVDHIPQIENVAEGIAGSDSFSLVASPFVLKTDPSLDNVLSDKLHIFAHVIKGTNLLQFYAQSPYSKKFIRVQLETGFDDWPLLFDRNNGDTLGNISIHARPIVVENGDGTYGGHTSVHVAYSIKQNNVTKMFVQRWKMEYFATDSLGFGPVDESFVISREEDPEIPDSTEIEESVTLYDNREFITSYSLQPVVVKFSKEWSQPAILVAFGRSDGNPDGDNINVYRWDNQSGLGIQNYRLGDWTKRQEITGRRIVEQFEPNRNSTYKWQFPIGANKLAMTDLSMDGNVIAFPYFDFDPQLKYSPYNPQFGTGGFPQGDLAVVMEWNGSEYIKKGDILYDWENVIYRNEFSGAYWRTSNHAALSLNNNGQAIILTTRLDVLQQFQDIQQGPFYNALSIYRWLPE